VLLKFIIAGHREQRNISALICIVVVAAILRKQLPNRLGLDQTDRPFAGAGHHGGSDRIHAVRGASDPM